MHAFPHLCIYYPQPPRLAFIYQRRKKKKRRSSPWPRSIKDGKGWDTYSSFFLKGKRGVYNSMQCVECAEQKVRGQGPVNHHQSGWLSLSYHFVCSTSQALMDGGVDEKGFTQRQRITDVPGSSESVRYMCIQSSFLKIPSSSSSRQALGKRGVHVNGENRGPRPKPTESWLVSQSASDINRYIFTQSVSQLAQQIVA